MPESDATNQKGLGKLKVVEMTSPSAFCVHFKPKYGLYYADADHDVRTGKFLLWRSGPDPLDTGTALCHCLCLFGMRVLNLKSVGQTVLELHGLHIHTYAHMQSLPFRYMD